MPRDLVLASADGRRPAENAVPRKTPYGLPMIEDCLTCPVVKDRIFCHLSEPIRERLDALSSIASYPAGAVLFVEGQEPRGVFILCHGRVKLSGGSARGKSLIFRLAHAGEIIGLPGTLSGKPYELTAEALEPIQANFVARKEFLAFLQQNGEAALRVAEMLSQIYHAACQEMRYLGLSRTASEKLARFLLDLTAGRTAENGSLSAKLTLTHEEIGEIIGASRETVTRLLAKFKRRSFIEIHGASLTIKNDLALRDMLDG
jgi:CRP/FNR family transcriptional regulator, cyclic AMP receptor protein